MPTKEKNKQRSVRGAVKRFRVSGSGSKVRIRRRAAFRAHNLGKQERKRLDQKIGSKVVSDVDKDRILRQLLKG